MRLNLLKSLFSAHSCNSSWRGCAPLNVEESNPYHKRASCSTFWVVTFFLFTFLFKPSVIIQFTYYYSSFQTEKTFHLFNLWKPLTTISNWSEQDWLFSVASIPTSQPNNSDLNLALTTPIKSPRPYSPVRCFFPSSIRMTERSRPFKTMYVQSDLSPCLQKE